MSGKDLLLFSTFILFSILLISVVSAEYSIDSFSRYYSTYGSSSWYDVIDNENVIISSNKLGMNYFSTDGDWLPINSKADGLKLNVNGEHISYGEDPSSGFKVKYKIYGDDKVNIQSKTWGNHGDAKLNRVDEFQRESDTSILINGVSQTISLGDTHQIQRYNWRPPGCGGSNYNKGYTYLNIININSNYFKVEIRVYEYDEECNSAYAKINSYIEKVPAVCGNDDLEDDEQCDDGNTDDGDGCSSICEIEPEPPECCDDEDCNNKDYYSDKICTDGDVYRDFHDFFCENGECEENIINELFEDCGEDEYGAWDNYCVGKEIWKDRTNYLKGCSDNSCYLTEDYENELVEECDYMCVNDECIDEPIEPECYVDSDCGIDYCLGEPNYCLDNDVYQDFVIYTCNNPGQLSAYCSDNTVPWLLEICDYMCVNGECIDKPEPVCGNDDLEEGEECEIDSDCGQGFYCDNCMCYEEPEPPECCDDSGCDDDYYDDKVCVDGDVYRDFHDFSCVDEKCVENIISELFDECDSDETCEDGECVEDDDDDDDNTCNNRGLYNNCRLNEVEDVLVVYDALKDDVKIINDDISLINKSQEKIIDNSWVLYLFFGIGGLIVLILIVLSVRG